MVLVSPGGPNTAETRDEDLLAAHLDGDPDAFSTLVRRNENRVFAVTYRITGDRANALDATQDAFVSAYRQAGSFRGDAAFSTWLYRIAANAAHDLLRKRRRFAEGDEEVDDRADPGAHVDETVAMRIDVARALHALPPDYREAVVLHDLGGVPYEEIARITRTKIGTVKSRISRGRRQLAELLEPGGRARASKDRDD